eukprot:15471975-Alexandrium_andersonii.AAC.1
MTSAIQPSGTAMMCADLFGLFRSQLRRSPPFDLRFDSLARRTEPCTRFGSRVEGRLRCEGRQPHA